MADPIFNVVMTGNILQGHELTTVANAAAEMFKVSPEQAQTLFGGTRRIVKKGVQSVAAKNIQASLKKAGIECRLVPVSLPAPKSRPEPEQATAGHSVTQSAQEPIPKPLPEPSSPSIPMDPEKAAFYRGHDPDLVDEVLMIIMMVTFQDEEKMNLDFPVSSSGGSGLSPKDRAEILDLLEHSLKCPIQPDVASASETAEDLVRAYETEWAARGLSSSKVFKSSGNSEEAKAALEKVSGGTGMKGPWPGIIGFLVAGIFVVPLGKVVGGAMGFGSEVSLAISLFTGVAVWKGIARMLRGEG